MKDLFFRFLILIGAAAIYAITALSVKADSELRFGGWSKHLSQNTEYNETHNAFLFEYKKLTVGYFRNSFNSDTATIAYHREWEVGTGLEFHLTSGVMYGYRDCLNFTKEAQEKHNTKNICPMIYPEFRFDAPLRPGIGLLGNAAVLTFGVEL